MEEDKIKKMKEKYKFYGWISIIIVFIIMISILVWHSNYIWSQANCYNSLINASSNIIERCGDLGIKP